MTGGDLQLAGHFRDHRQGEVELGDTSWNVELDEDRASPGVGVLGGEWAEYRALVAFEVTEQRGRAGEKVQALVVQFPGVEPHQPAAEQAVGKGEVLTGERDHDAVQVIRPRFVLPGSGAGGGDAQPGTLHGACHLRQERLEAQVGGGVRASEGSVEDCLCVGSGLGFGALALPLRDRRDGHAEVLGKGPHTQAQGETQCPGLQAGPVVHGCHAHSLPPSSKQTRVGGGTKVEQK